MYRLLPPTLIAVMLAAISSLTDPVAARKSDDYFSQVPRLLSATASLSVANGRGSTLAFTVNVPSGAGSGLKTLVIEQESNYESLQVDLDQVSVVGSDRWQQDDPIVPIKVQLLPTGKGQIQIQFDQPVSPGTTITLRLKPSTNPRTSGVYLYGVTALSGGSDPFNYFLGYGTLTFMDRSGDNHFTF